ncbi:hypothetical protein GWI33_021887 [Rhynchophorus ferrugineus]|uniref:Uncharacterized protein n=1 Tax=Rhynchophorus ferrugineus TaxID=354439 RepID=A0A834HNC8_RHYFE|nr:hypothetical protein GWI33_021887 [Rhynchophorus ferrugineus]
MIGPYRSQWRLKEAPSKLAPPFISVADFARPPAPAVQGRASHPERLVQERKIRRQRCAQAVHAYGPSCIQAADIQGQPTDSKASAVICAVQRYHVQIRGCERREGKRNRARPESFAKTRRMTMLSPPPPLLCCCCSSPGTDGLCTPAGLFGSGFRTW